MPKVSSQADYKQRMNAVFQYIETHLESDLSLTKVAEIASFSPYHFHRIFKHITGEALNELIIRKRIEKSAATLLHKREISITELSMQNGFSSNTSFTRAFKKFYGVSPSDFRKQYPHKFSKIGKVSPSYEQYICVIEELKNWVEMNAKIRISETGKIEVAYISCIGTQNIERSYGKLFEWAYPLGLTPSEDIKPIIIYHDSFKITDHDKVRISAGITLNIPVKAAGEVGLTTIPAGKYISGMYEISLNEFEKAWTGLFLWMNENGYQKADRKPFEIHHNNFHEHPQKKSIVELFIPVK
ncbi:AraC family transcriptional regulator [Fulvivirga lutea]|uniref:AraC family transcriptional regulator n=1 Tax=Fulvivirga lutea TaxID=2810512 RepID=A0A975A269_9BACT|nr:AraC family transcriptional regulator [Fulvivirga lutea]QSE99126.1 AraC family transcriptional regulator [Fulvivirga lutea]